MSEPPLVDPDAPCSGYRAVDPGDGKLHVYDEEGDEVIVLPGGTSFEAIRIVIKAIDVSYRRGRASGEESARREIRRALGLKIEIERLADDVEVLADKVGALEAHRAKEKRR